MYWNADPKPVKADKKSNLSKFSISSKPIKKVSKVRAKELKTYGQKRKEFLSKHTNCQAKLVGCTGHVNDLHHCAKRGKNLNNETTFLAVCRMCHNQIEFVLKANERRERGLLV